MDVWATQRQQGMICALARLNGLQRLPGPSRWRSGRAWPGVTKARAGVPVTEWVDELDHATARRLIARLQQHSRTPHR